MVGQGLYPIILLNLTKSSIRLDGFHRNPGDARGMDKAPLENEVFSGATT